ncbi:MAG: helix-turn-helix transcriptional regulator [Candidatus Dormibacteria bacterium]
MPSDRTPAWSFLTNHACVLLSIAQDPGIRLREIGDSVGITERAAHRIVSELAASGYISRTRDGRRSHYTIQSNMPLPDSLARGKRVGHLLTILGPQTHSQAHRKQPQRS